MNTIPLIFDPITNDHHPYIQLAVRTAAPLVGRANLIHSVLGIADELLEINNFFHSASALDLNDPETSTALIKELGDVTWFTALYAHYISFDAVDSNSTFAGLWEEACAAPAPNDLFGLTLATGAAGRCVGIVKAEYAYGKPIPDDVARQMFVNALSVVNTICLNMGVDLEEVLTRNVAKLAARYKKASFTAEEAINRDESKE